MKRITNQTLKRVISVLMIAAMLFASYSTVLIASAASSKKLSSCKFTVASTVAYTGKALTPTVTVKDGKTTLKKGTHYTVSYSSNKNLGTGKVVIKAKSGSGYTGSKTLTFKIAPAKVTSLKATATTSSVTLSWKKVTGATKYIVYSYNTSTKKYTKLTTVSTNKVTIKNLSAGKTYAYAVKAVAIKNGKTYNGTTSAVFKCATAPAKVTGLKKTTVTNNSVKLTWTKVSGATGYKVYSYNSSTKKYTALKTVTTNSTTVTSLKGSTTYKFAVRAYRKVSDTAYYGSYSSLLSVKTTSAHKHSYTVKLIKEPTCDETGAKGYQCKCGYYYREEIPAKGHVWKTKTVHHDAVTQTFDVYEVVETWYFRYWLTEWGAKNGYGNWPSDPKRYYVKFAEVRYTINQYASLYESGTEKSDYEYLWKADKDIHKDIAMANKECYKTNGHAFIGPTVEGLEYAADTYGILNWDEVKIKEKETVIGTKTFTLKEAYDEKVTTCTKCGAKK